MFIPFWQQFFLFWYYLMLPSLHCFLTRRNVTKIFIISQNIKTLHLKRPVVRNIKQFLNNISCFDFSVGQSTQTNNYNTEQCMIFIIPKQRTVSFWFLLSSSFIFSSCFVKWLENEKKGNISHVSVSMRKVWL